LIWFGLAISLAYPSKEEGLFTCSNDSFLPSRAQRKGEGGRHPVIYMNQPPPEVEIEKTTYPSSSLKLSLFCRLKESRAENMEMQETRKLQSFQGKIFLHKYHIYTF
jgi:hypothetical protein